MSVTTRVVFRDDYTGEDIAPNAANQRIIILDGVKYELDFSASSNKVFDQALAPFIRNAKGVRLSDALYKELVAADTSRATPVESKTERQAIRHWWEQNWKRLGLPQPGKSGRGRIHAVVREAYYSSNRGGEG